MNATATVAHQHRVAEYRKAAAAIFFPCCFSFALYKQRYEFRTIMTCATVLAFHFPYPQLISTIADFFIFYNFFGFCFLLSFFLPFILRCCFGIASTDILSEHLVSSHASPCILQRAFSFVATCVV